MRTVRTSSAVPVSVNHVVIANADIAREVQNHRGTSPKAAWDEATRALVVRELLLQRAHEMGLVAAPQSVDGLRETDDEALIRAVLDAEVTTPTADEATCRRYYDANQRRFCAPDLFEPAHILFKVNASDTEAFAAAVKRAEAVLDTLRREPARFADLARGLSDCSSGSEGGRLGQVTGGETTSEFEAALRTLQPGQICAEPVRTRYGVHVIRLDRKIAGEVLPFERVQGRIAAWLEEASWCRAVSQYISLLAGRAEIEGFDMPAAASPLLQ